MNRFLYCFKTYRRDDGYGGRGGGRGGGLDGGHGGVVHGDGVARRDVGVELGGEVDAWDGDGV